MSVQSTSSLERHRAEDMSIEELRREYVNLKAIQFSQHIEEEMLNKKVEMLREESVRLQQSTEIEEEHVANQLLRRLNSAERDVRKYEHLIHEEEEAMEELTKQIAVIHAQQHEVESELKKHQGEHITLQGQLLNTELKKNALGRELLDEWHRYLGVLVNQLAVLRDREEKERRGGDQGGPPALSPLTPTTSPNEKENEKEKEEEEEGNASPSSHPTVVRLERQLNRLLAEHAEVVKGAEEIRRQYGELLKRLKGIEDTAFLDIAQTATYRESLRDAQEKLLSYNPRKVVS